MSVLDIRSAISQELEATPEYYDFKVVQSVREAGMWRVKIQPEAVFADGERAHVVLDESFEGAKAWWAGPFKGGAEVLTVIAEDDEIVLKDATARPPEAEGYLRLYPPRYLKALASCWGDAAWAEQALACLSDLGCPQEVETNPLSGHAFRFLRRAQRRALKLVNYSSSFLFGPPGTGKTTTLGVLLAEFLHLNPRARVLLLSTTNLAVDQATVAVDKALEGAGRQALRERVQRLGSRIVASHYSGREHLLPVRDRELIASLTKLEAQRPAADDLAAFNLWSEQIEGLRQRLRAQTLAVLCNARLVSMTTTRAAFSLDDLRCVPRFDLVVFDEASQIGLAHALALMPLGRTRLFAGDPKQLAPVVRSPAKFAKRWLARSPFSEKPGDGASVCFLDEQSRMAEPISQLVSHIFYDGKLRVAADAQKDERWRAKRLLAFADVAPDEHLHLLQVAENGSWSAKYHGPIRYSSADLIANLIQRALEGGQLVAADLIVLTPFRAQRALIRQRIRACGVIGVKVSTVHRAQGSEVPVVIFDPVDASSDFLLGDEAKRLINVALSRAQAKIILVHTPHDTGNPTISRISQRVRLQADSRPTVLIEQIANRSDFPACAIGMRVQIGLLVGEVSGVSRDETELHIVNAATGEEQVFMVAHLRRQGAV